MIESALNLILKGYQRRFFESIARYPACVSGWGTGKTLIALLKGIKMSEDSSDNLGIVCRKEFTDLEKSTIQDFIKYTGITPDSKREVNFPNGSKIMFLHAKELDVLKNTNIGWFVIEQAEEMETDEQFTYLRGRLRRSEAKIRQGIVIANTNGHNWIWNLWKINPTQDTEFHLTEATSFENTEHIPADTIVDWHKLEKQQPEVYRRFVLNSWDESDTVSYVIPEQIIRQCVDLEQLDEDTRALVSVDPAYGGDRCVIMPFVGTRLDTDKMLVLRKDLDEKVIAGHINGLRARIKADLVSGDAIGNGHGIFTELDYQNISNHKIISSEKSTNPEAYVNLRAEMWWEVRRMFLAKQINMVNHQELIAELSAVKYTPNSKNIIKIESKEDIKKRLGKSPDLADAFIYGIYSLRFIKPKAIEQVEIDRQRRARLKKPKYLGSFMSV